MTEALPKTIGRYEIQREIGRGTMGVVYQARDPLLGRTIALKTIELAFAISPEQRQVFETRFFIEARIAARLSHPGIVVVHDVGRDPGTGTLYIALEYLEGRTLAEILKARVPLEWREVLHVVRKVAEALHHAHAQRVVHRDVKPANIMILPSGEPKIMDFGIAKMETARLRLTRAGESFGTPLYMSPEQALGRKVDPRSDLFGLGAITYEMLTARLAFGAESLAKIVGRLIREEPLPTTRLVPELPPEVDYLVARALAKSPSDRYPDARTMAEDIEDILSGQPPRHRASWAPVGGFQPDSVPPPEPDELEEAELEVLLGQPETRSREVDLEAELSTLVSTSATEREVAAEPPPPPSPRAREPAAAHKRPRAPRSGARVAAILGFVALLGAAALYLSQRQAGPVGGGTQPARSTLPSASTPMAPRTASSPSPGTLAPADAPPSPISVPPPPSPADRASGLEATPSASSPAERPARLAIDFERPLKEGRLRVWVDEELVLEEELDARVTKKVIFIKKRKGIVEDVLEVSPGRHVVKVEVAWDDNVKTKRISGSFSAGVTRHLEARLGGLLKKDLSLEWR